MKAHRFLWAGLAAVGVLSGCDDRGGGGNHAIQSRVALESFDNCGELEGYIEDAASSQMRSQLEQLKETPYWYWGGPVAMEDGSGAPRGGAGGPAAYTTTNTQVSGVDEADFVKNDGTRIFVLSGNKLYANHSWPADSLRTSGSLEIEGYPREMFLDGNRIAVFSSVYTPIESAAQPGAMSMCLDAFSCGYYAANTLKVTVVDVSDLAHPTVASELYLPGYYVNSRMVDGRVRLVSGDSLRWPASVKWYPEYQPGLFEDRALWSAAIDQLIAANEKSIRSAALEQWLPVGRYRSPGGELHEVGYQCSEFSKTNAPTRMGLVSVVTLSLDPAALAATQGAALHRTSVLAEPGEIYASQDSLYVATGHWWWWPEPGQADHTYLHKFDIRNPARTSYVASGGVEGHIVDQFSMDEHDGFLRIATTVSTRVPDQENPQNVWGRLENTNRITVLGQSGTALSKVGQSEAIAPGEAIYSARFVGDRGYVVTFLQVDPLFTFDLSDPTQPRKVGELKVPGFSTYLHPLDENHLLTIGIKTDAQGGWNGSTLQLSIFDVTDFANPALKFTRDVGTAYGWSEALYDHKAFNYFPARKLLAIPFSDWNSGATSPNDYWSSFVSDLRVFEVSTETGFTPRGAVAMNDLYQQQTYEWDSYRWTYFWSPAIRRSVMADNFVYAISDAGIRVADITDLSTPIATTVFERYQGVRP